jgi:hypothetical protein
MPPHPATANDTFVNAEAAARLDDAAASSEAAENSNNETTSPSESQLRGKDKTKDGVKRKTVRRQRDASPPEANPSTSEEDDKPYAVRRRDRSR